MSLDNIGKDDNIDEEALNQIRKKINDIKLILHSKEDGEITISAYDTAWVALVKIVGGSWNMHPDKCKKGMTFFKENLYKLQDENAEHMPIGFELLKLQSRDGSFLFSPSSTAYALMQTKDENAHKYPEKTVQTFNGGADLICKINCLFFDYSNSRYGDSSDVWICRTLYKMPYVNNDVYLQLAKLDYSNCQAVHCVEWEKNPKQQLASIFEPKKFLERFAWAKTAALLQTLRFHIKDEETKSVFLNLFSNSINGRDHSNNPAECVWQALEQEKREEELLEILLTNLDYLGFQMFRSHGQEFSHYLNQALSSWQNKGNKFGREAELIVQMINVMAGYWELHLNPHYQSLLEVTNEVCHALRSYQSNKGFYNGAYCDPETINSYIEKVLLQKVI
uniref:Terpene synthase N-terminal domain-containing protein n=1 Tax=Glycine max TaxID=3847 RepID=A0A0R0KJG0_SOYBN